MMLSRCAHEAWSEESKLNGEASAQKQSIVRARRAPTNQRLLSHAPTSWFVVPDYRTSSELVFDFSGYDVNQA
jgi:hypothetical protein